MDTKTDVIVVRLDAETKQRFAEYCQRTGQSMSGELLRHIYSVAPPGCPTVALAISDQAMAKFDVLCRAKGTTTEQMLIHWISNAIARLDS